MGLQLIFSELFATLYTLSHVLVSCFLFMAGCKMHFGVRHSSDDDQGRWPTVAAQGFMPTMEHPCTIS